MGKSKKTSAPSAPAPLPPGNEFQFWVPKGGGGKPPLPLMPPPAPPASPGTGVSASAATSASTKTATETPMEYVTTHFTPAKKVPFGSGAAIGTEYEHVTSALLLAAAVELLQGGIHHLRTFRRGEPGVGGKTERGEDDQDGSFKEYGVHGGSPMIW